MVVRSKSQNVQMATAKLSHPCAVGTT